MYVYRATRTYVKNINVLSMIIHNYFAKSNEVKDKDYRFWVLVVLVVLVVFYAQRENFRCIN